MTPLSVVRMMILYGEKEIEYVCGAIVFSTFQPSHLMMEVYPTGVRIGLLDVVGTCTSLHSRARCMIQGPRQRNGKPFHLLQ